jgi:hypothetical protein
MNKSSKNNRRHFLKVTAAGVAGAAMLKGTNAEAKPKKTEKIISIRHMFTKKAKMKLCLERYLKTTI